MKHTNKENFENDVLKSDKIVIVDFYASWSGQCRTLSPILEDISKIEDRASIVKVDVDENPELAQKYGIRGIPSMLFFKNGKIVKTFVGVHGKEELLSEIEKNA